MDKPVDKSASILIGRDVDRAVNLIRKVFFDIIDDIKASDNDNVEHLKTILNDEDLAKQFAILGENRSKIIRKKILDNTGDLNRQLREVLENYKIEFDPNTEFKGNFK